MARLPKYKTNAESAYRHSKKNGPVSLEQEKIFTSNPEFAIKYALDVKKQKLSDFVENVVFQHYCNLAKTLKKYKHSVLLNDLLKYLKMTNYMPEKYKNKLMNYSDPQILPVYAKIFNERLSEKHEMKLFESCQKTDNVWPLVEYQYIIKTRLPDYMHNYMLAKNLEETKSNSCKNAILAYFLNLKDLKNTLVKLSAGFDKDIKLKDVIDQL